MKVFIVYASAGHGHKKVAEAIYQEFKEVNQGVTELKLIDLLDYTPSFFRKSYPLIYYWMVKHIPQIWGWCYHITNIPILLKILNPFRRCFNFIQTQKFRTLLENEKPDFIINTHFLLPNVLGPMASRGSVSYRMITVVTDFKVHGFWINPGQEFFIGMCEATRKGLLDWGIPEEKISLWGIPIHPKFRKHLGRPLLQKEMGFDEGRRTLLMTSGSFGMGPTEKFLDVLKPLAQKIQVIVVTGTNKELLLKLSGKEYPFPVRVLGYVENMDQLMEVSDLAIAKPGGSTVCELLVKACPFLMLEPIPGQEEGNGEVLILEGISQYLKKPQDLLEKLAFFDDPNYAKRLRTAIANFARPEAGLRIVEFINTQHVR